jgi:hypothetical protein
VLEKAAAEFPVVALTGPRQSGKTTLLKHLFASRATYVSLEAPDVREAAASDPRGFLSLYRPPVIIDEVQNAPDLLPYIKEQVDKAREAKGQFFITGSQNLLLLSRISESLAGIAAILHLLPLSGRERAGTPTAPFPWATGFRAGSRPVPSFPEPWAGFLRGFYPEIALAPDRDARLWHSSYMQTYLERDVRQLTQVGDLALFQGFLKMLAARSGQLLNLSALSRDLGVALNTAKRWLSILEATFQVSVLRPFHANAGKRLVKTPKAYFLDTGTLCYLLGVRDTDSASSDLVRGPLFESFVFSELMKHFFHAGEQASLSFWRTSHGVEVDFLVEEGRRIIPVEAKAVATPRQAMAEGIHAFRSDHGDKAGRGFVIHLGDVRLPLGEDVLGIPFSDFLGG